MRRIGETVRCRAGGWVRRARGARRVQRTAKEAVGGTGMQKRRRNRQKMRQEQPEVGGEEEEVVGEMEMGTGTGWEVNIRRTR